MVPELRERFNQEFTTERYDSFVEDLQNSFERSLGFRVCETPLFLPDRVCRKLADAAEAIGRQITDPEFQAPLDRAIPLGMRVPNENPHTDFLQIDFALTQDESGEVVPQLIELQGFPSLYGFQFVLNKKIRSHFGVPAELTSYFNGVTGDLYLDLLRRCIVGDCDPENVILLEIEPKKQVTRIDFYCMHELLGIPTVCVSDLVRRGNRLFYRQDSREVPVRRIYNRVVFEAGLRARRDCQVLFEDLDVVWVGHPNWFFKISKFVLPLLQSPHSPACHYLSDLSEYPGDLENYVLKPLFSFAGGGVQVGPTREALDAVQDRTNHILQRRVEYAPLIRTPQGLSKAEVRMMFLWGEGPLLINNLVRTSRGRLMGVSANKAETWVGATIAYHTVDFRD